MRASIEAFKTVIKSLTTTSYDFAIGALILMKLFRLPRPWPTPDATKLQTGHPLGPPAAHRTPPTSYLTSSSQALLPLSLSLSLPPPFALPRLAPAQLIFPEWRHRGLAPDSRPVARKGAGKRLWAPCPTRYRGREGRVTYCRTRFLLVTTPLRHDDTELNMTSHLVGWRALRHPDCVSLALWLNILTLLLLMLMDENLTGFRVGVIG